MEMTDYYTRLNVIDTIKEYSYLQDDINKRFDFLTEKEFSIKDIAKDCSRDKLKL